MLLDFKEIPLAKGGGGLQDSFELFARDWLEYMGFTILQHPDRGADGKKDIIVEETRDGVVGKTKIKWLVSCKHYAHSGIAVKDTDEPDIIDRVHAHECDAFFGIYSTLPATSLSNKIKGYESKIEAQLFDRERIESALLKTSEGISLARRYFPKSTEVYLKEHPIPANIYSTMPELNCENCGANLLEKTAGIFVILRMYNSKGGDLDRKEKKVYCACKGDCDHILERRYLSENLISAGWRDIGDLKIPTLFIKNMMAFINDLKDDVMEEEVIEKMKKIYLSAFPYVSRHSTSEETEIIKMQIMYGL